MKKHYDFSTVMYGSDEQMDQCGVRSDAINLPPAKCKLCGMPDLDYVPQPYFLKGAGSPLDMDQAVAGNFFVKANARKILETVVPKDCLFYPTHDLKKRTPTPWFLAVPVHKGRTATPLKHIERCKACREPKGCGVGLCEVHPIPWQGHEILKTANWISDTQTEEEYLEYLKQQGGTPHPLYLASIERRRKALGVEPHPGLWTRRGIGRLLHFSPRLQALLRRAGLKGLKGQSDEPQTLSPNEGAWVEEKLQLLARKKLIKLQIAKPAAKAGRISPALNRWFQSYLEKNAAKSPKRYNFAAIEKRQNVVLPPAYKDFIGKVGTKLYQDVDGIEGFTARILPPGKLDFRNYRRSKLQGNEESKLDCVMFAVTGHGDCFCFDLASPAPDYTVYHFQHETEIMQFYARNFAECIKRFSW